MLLTKKRLIDSDSGIKVSTKGYSYWNVIINLSNVFYFGDNCSEDIKKQVGTGLKLIV